MSKMPVEDAPEETLDPPDTAAWSAFRRLAHRMVDDMLDHLSGLPEQPVWRPMPTEVRESFHQPVPRNGVGADAAYEEFLRLVRPYPNGNLHPRYWGWVKGNGTPLGMMAHGPYFATEGTGIVLSQNGPFIHQHNSGR